MASLSTRTFTGTIQNLKLLEKRTLMKSILTLFIAFACSAATWAAPWVQSGDNWEHPSGWVLTSRPDAKTNPQEDNMIMMEGPQNDYFSLTLRTFEDPESARTGANTLVQFWRQNGFTFQSGPTGDLIARRLDGSSGTSQATVGHLEKDGHFLMFSLVSVNKGFDLNSVLKRLSRK